MLRKLICALLLGSCSILSAQTTIVDINPDSCACVNGLAAKTITLDLNTDGTNDFVFSVSSSNNSGGTGTASITALGSNSIAADAIGAFSLNAGIDVITQPSWINNQVKIEVCTMMGYTGYWPALQTDKFLAVKFYAGASLYCGWIKLDVNVTQTNVQVKIKEYGYNTTCSVSCTTWVEELSSNNSVSIYPIPNNGTFKLKAKKNIESGEIYLINILGQKVYEQKILSGETNITVTHLPKGIYYCFVLQNKEQLSTTMLIIE